MGSTVDPGATDVTLGTVEGAGDAAGEAELAVDPRQVDDKEGGRLRPASRAGTLTVTGEGTASATESAESSSAGPVEELGGSDDGPSLGVVGLIGALAAIGALSAFAVARRRS
jgi:hypothetical protein